MGAAGLTCSTSEVASRGGAGVEIDLDRVAQRETGMNAYEIMLSESQERMLLVVRSGREAEVTRIFDKWDLDAAPIGRVSGDGLLRVRHQGRLAAEVPCRALTDDAPAFDRPAAQPSWWPSPEVTPADLAEPSDWNAVSPRNWPDPRSSRAAASSTSSTTTWCAATPSSVPAATPAWSGSRAWTSGSP